jgi:hypothetical protein
LHIDGPLLYGAGADEVGGAAEVGPGIVAAHRADLQLPIDGEDLGVVGAAPAHRRLGVTLHLAKEIQWHEKIAYGSMTRESDAPVRVTGQKVIRIRFRPRFPFAVVVKEFKKFYILLRLRLHNTLVMTTKNIVIIGKKVVNMFRHIIRSRNSVGFYLFCKVDNVHCATYNQYLEE